MSFYYFDIETCIKGEKPNAEMDEIITIQYQKIDSKNGKTLGDLIILKSWESSEKEILENFLNTYEPMKLWNFIPVGVSLTQYDFIVLAKRAKKYDIKLKLTLLLKNPFIDIKSILVILNKGSFTGSSLENFTKKSKSGRNIKAHYENEMYDKIEYYIKAEAEAFIEFYQWISSSFPQFYEAQFPKSNPKILELTNLNSKRKCPKCGSSCLEKFDELRDGMGMEGMTEGQFTESLAGTWGTYYA
ncbi:MAG: hypothetical protein ACTSRH_16775 [Promethearchaeota archaeon]